MSNPLVRGQYTRIPRRAVACGFTLVEVLIALSLLALLMLVLTGAMGSIGATERRIDARFEEADDVAMAERLLQQVLGSVSARTVVAVNAAPDRAPAPWYQGQSDGLSWVGVMPGGYGGGGRHFFRLALESQAQDGNALVLRRAPWTPENVPPDWSALESVILLRDVAALSLRYWDGVQHVWLDRWPAPERGANAAVLPEMVELHWATTAQELPVLVVRVRPLVASDPSSTGVVYGPPPR